MCWQQPIVSIFANPRNGNTDTLSANSESATMRNSFFMDTEAYLYYLMQTIDQDQEYHNIHK